MVAVSGVGFCEIGESLVGRDLGRLVHEAGGVLEIAVLETFGDAGPAVGAGDLESVGLSGGLSFAGHGLGVVFWRIEIRDPWGSCGYFNFLSDGLSSFRLEFKTQRVDEGDGSGCSKMRRTF